MQTTGFKICPNCRLQAPMDAAECVGCGRQYVSTAPPPKAAPAQTPSAPSAGAPTAQMPAGSQTANPYGSLKLAQYVPGEHAIWPAFVFWLLIPFVTPLYNRQWWKGVMVFLVTVTDAYSLYSENDLLRGLASILWCLVGIDGMLNTFALNRGYALREFDLFGGEHFRQSQGRFSAGIVLACAFIVLACTAISCKSFANWKEHIDPKTQTAKKFNDVYQAYDLTSREGNVNAAFWLRELGEPDIRDPWVTNRDGHRYETWVWKFPNGDISGTFDPEINVFLCKGVKGYR